ncbi:endonuclease/exonuclease/phosphatase family protein [Halobacteriovorax sp. HLS]|uniref:endonuclease/exonuclease/phosphatase family protein n=1 Tax=Halobacteriovorax sp. HLS TaxID=2234000 RepID=UPI000FD96C37|nr:endonuclease/exonuclease/phosphatase family protein [Halobacteriovorax sp. HLS]
MNTKEKISILSLNIYFDDKSGEVRYPQIISFLKNHHFDIICLQEVTDSFLTLLNSCPRLSSEYGQRIYGEGRYRNIIISKLSSLNKGIINLPSQLSRQAPFIDIKVSKQLLRIYSVHLESCLDDEQIRLAQLDHLYQKYFEDGINFILCGDMNFGDEDSESTTSANLYHDHSNGDKTYTFDVENNALASSTRFPDEPSRRLDRFLSNLEIESKNYNVHRSNFSDHYAISIDLFL